MSRQKQQQQQQDDDSASGTEVAATAVRPSTINSNSNTEHLIGKGCRVFFNQGDDFFGRTRSATASGWYFGTVQAAARPKKGRKVPRVVVVFDDNTESRHEVPDVHLVTAGTGRTQRHLLYAADAGVVVADTRPTVLHVGDLVFGWFQGGVENARFRGRVGAVGRTPQGLQLCDIAYDDGDYEYNVPYGSRDEHIPPTVTLIERGVEHPGWLVGLKVPIPCRHKRYAGQTGVVVEAVQEKPVVLQYTDPNKVSSPTTQRCSYCSVVNALFEAARQRTDRRFVTWPHDGAVLVHQTEDDTKPAAATKTNRRSAILKQVLKDTETSKTKHTNNNIKPTARTAKSVDRENGANRPNDAKPAASSKKVERQTLHFSSSDDDDDDNRGSDSDDDDGPVFVSQPTRSIKRKASPAPKAPPKKKVAVAVAAASSQQGTATKCRSTRSITISSNDALSKTKATCTYKAAKGRTTASASSNIASNPNPAMAAVAISSAPRLNELTGYRTADSISEMNPSLSDNLFKALNSPDPTIGAHLLQFIASFHPDQVPADQDLRTLVESILLDGPKTHRGIFPDAHRLTVAHKFFHETLVQQQGLSDHIAALFSPDYWQRVYAKMIPPSRTSATAAHYYMLPGDETRPRLPALKRTGLTLHARASCMETFNVLLQQQLRGCLSDEDDASYRHRPIVCEILGHARGSKGALEIATEVYTYTWIHFGHFLVGNLSGIPGITNDDADMVASQTQRLLIAMGQTLSLLALLYSCDTHEDMKAVALIMGSIARGEFAESSLDVSAMVQNTPTWIQTRIKLGFILKLDKRIVPQLFHTLADMLQVAQEFNIIFGH